jgi:hypothetical protein
MKKIHLLFSGIILVFSLANGSCIFKGKRHPASAGDIHLRGAINQHSNLPFDSNLVITFYLSYPALNKYEKEVVGVYRQHHFNHIWYDERGVVEFGQTLYNKVNDLNT